MNQTPITDEYLLANGWESETFFFQIGGGEDEDDCLIFVKDGVALTKINRRWYKADHNDLTYQNGFASSGEVEFIEDL